MLDAAQHAAAEGGGVPGLQGDGQSKPSANTDNTSGTFAMALLIACSSRAEQFAAEIRALDPDLELRVAPELGGVHVRIDALVPAPKGHEWARARDQHAKVSFVRRGNRRN